MRIFPLILQIASLMIALVSILIQVFHIQIQPQKELRLGLTKSCSVCVNDDQLRKKIQIFYEGKQINNLSTFALEVENVGGAEIGAKDYSDPIAVSFSNNAQVITATVAEKNPKDINIVPIIITPSQVQLRSGLLNHGESASFKIQVADNEGTPELYARIAGTTIVRQTQSEWQSSQSQTQILISFIAIVFILIAIFLTIWGFRSVRTKTTDWQKNPELQTDGDTD